MYTHTHSMYAGLCFSWVSQQEPSPSIRYSIQWQPYALPSAQPCCLNEPKCSSEQETVKFLINLDELVALYASTTLKLVSSLLSCISFLLQIPLRCLPEDFASEDHVQMSYLAYWRDLAMNSTSGVSEMLMEKQSDDIVQLVHQIGKTQKGSQFRFCCF